MPEVRALTSPLLTGLALLVLAVTACSDESGTSGPSGPDGPDGPGNDGQVTYHNTIRGLVEENCSGCHTAGGIGPFELASYSDLADLGPGLVAEVTSRRMPPWHADPECRTMQGERLLGDEAVAAFAAWEQAGMPEGDPADYVAPEGVSTSVFDQLGEPGLALSGRPYTANRDRPDDYRCLPVQHTFEEDTFVLAADVLPDQRDIVHHVIVYLVPPTDIDAMEGLAARDEAPGYTCYGGPRVGNFEMVSGWVPGAEPQLWPEGSAVLIPAGYRLVMQMHYNVAYLDDDEAVPEDNSQLLLWTMPAGEAPESLVSFTLFANFGIAIPAGDPHSIHEATHSVPFAADVIGIVPHMHQLGTSIRVDLQRTNGDEECLVDIPYWDFNWQRFYQYPEDQVLQVLPGDEMTLRCEYDNRPSNQAIVNGERLEPRDVYWGDSTFDEMCLHFLMTRVPYNEGETGLCGGFDSCVQSCPSGDSQCALGCSFQAGQDCALCTLTSFNDCASQFCSAQTGPLYACFPTCDDPFSCLQTQCASQYDALYDCLEPHILAGECNDDLNACEVMF